MNTLHLLAEREDSKRYRDAKLLLDLTVYLDQLDEDTLDSVIDLYEGVCAVRDRGLYAIDETLCWVTSDHPVMTLSARDAQLRGTKRPHLEASRRRIRDGRPFAVGYWDGRAIDDSQGSWSLSFQRVKVAGGEMRSFVRCLLPLQEPHETVRHIATLIASRLPFTSGHGGFAFAYDPWHADRAFNAIYASCRRYWGVDVEYLAGTLPLMNHFIKGVSWITMLGRAMANDMRVVPALAALRGSQDGVIRAVDLTFGTLFVVGARPVVGDRHRGAQELAPLIELARALKPLLPDAHADFPGQRFFENGNTLAWIRRFVEPEGWS